MNFIILLSGANSFNSSPMRLKFLKSSTSKEKLSKLVSDDNISKVINAPVCTIIGMDIEFWRDLPRNYLREDAKQYLKMIQPSLRLQLLETHQFREVTL